MSSFMVRFRVLITMKLGRDTDAGANDAEQNPGTVAEAMRQRMLGRHPTATVELVNEPSTFEFSIPASDLATPTHAAIYVTNMIRAAAYDVGASTSEWPVRSEPHALVTESAVESRRVD